MFVDVFSESVHLWRFCVFGEVFSLFVEVYRDFVCHCGGLSLLGEIVCGFVKILSLCGDFVFVEVFYLFMFICLCEVLCVIVEIFVYLWRFMCVCGRF